MLPSSMALDGPIIFVIYDLNMRDPAVFCCRDDADAPAATFGASAM
jgi:hypothetical protein